MTETTATPCLERPDGPHRGAPAPKAQGEAPRPLRCRIDGAVPSGIFWGFRQPNDQSQAYRWPFLCRPCRRVIAHDIYSVVILCS